MVGMVAFLEFGRASYVVGSPTSGCKMKTAYSVSQDRDLYPPSEDTRGDTIKTMKSLESIGAPWGTALMEKEASMNRIDRIAGKVAMFGIRSPGGPRPKFEVGDTVKTWDPHLTEVWSVGDYDDFAGDRRYVVMDPKTRRKLNIMEKDIRLASVKKGSRAMDRKADGTAFSKFQRQLQELRVLSNSIRDTLRQGGYEMEADVLWLRLSDGVREAEMTLRKMR